MTAEQQSPQRVFADALRLRTAQQQYSSPGGREPCIINIDQLCGERLAYTDLLARDP
uniref:Uncharacterized protein n=1 Tax=Rhizobium meliloti TaxID=382 RepID=I2E1R8_RHIML|nr:short hypothetical protein [Sinorhizobium meliloti]